MAATKVKAPKKDPVASTAAGGSSSSAALKPPAKPIAAPAPAAVAVEEDPEKKAKNIKKKLKQIEEIRAKQVAGASLNADQENKLSTEAALISELEELGI